MNLTDFDNLDLGQSSPPPIPVIGSIVTKQAARVINGIPTEILVQYFSDRIFIILTQVGRIGSMIQINPPPTMISSPLSVSSTLYPTLPIPSPFITISPVFGTSPSSRISTFHDLIAIQIGAIAFSKTAEHDQSKPVLFGIGLKLRKETGEDEEDDISEEERKLFSEIMEMMMECI